jgi:hypothetical protein
LKLSSSGADADWFRREKKREKRREEREEATRKERKKERTISALPLLRKEARKPANEAEKAKRVK